MTSKNTHWDSIFSNTADTKLGWYEKDVSKTIEFLHQIPFFDTDLTGRSIFVSGAGTSALVDTLITTDAQVVLNDISAEALRKLTERLPDTTNNAQWLCQDISLPLSDAITPLDIWVDRAVLHFLTEEKDIQGYFNNITSKLKKGGWVLFAEFSKTGAPTCASLPVHRYTIEELSERLGPSFTLISSCNHIYNNPNGDPRPYVYGLYQRTC